MLNGEVPFNNPSQAIHGSFSPMKVIVSNQCESLLRWMLHKDIRKRAPIEYVKNHPWLKEDLNVPPHKFF